MQVENQGGGPHGGSAATAVGTPVPDGTGDELCEFPGPEGLVRNSQPANRTGDAVSAGKSKQVGRPKQFNGKLRVPMTDEQREKVEALRAAGGCSAAEAVRRLIDGQPVPEPREVVAVDAQQYRDLLDAISGVRTELNRGVGNVYRFVRDSYSGRVPDESEIAALRADLDSGLSDLSDLAQVVKEASPW